MLVLVLTSAVQGLSERHLGAYIVTEEAQWRKRIGRWRHIALSIAVIIIISFVIGKTAAVCLGVLSLLLAWRNYILLSAAIALGVDRFHAVVYEYSRNCEPRLFWSSVFVKYAIFMALGLLLFAAKVEDDGGERWFWFVGDIGFALIGSGGMFAFQEIYNRIRGRAGDQL